MKKGWTTILVRPETAARLQAEARHLVEEYKRGSIELEVTDRSGQQRGCGLSADAVIWRLIRKLDNHKERRRRARKNRGRKKMTAAAESLPPAAGSVASQS